MIRRILRENSLAYCFSHVFGGDVEPDKSRGIQRFLDDAAQGTGRRCQAFYDESAMGSPVPAQSTAIITDTVGDVEAAVKSGIRAIGVAWGMHTEEQLLAAGAEFVAIWPQEILAHLFGAVPPKSNSCACPATPAPPSLDGSSSRPRALRRTAGAKALQARMTSSKPYPQESAPPEPPTSSTVVPQQARGAETDSELLLAVTRTMR